MKDLGKIEAFGEKREGEEMRCGVDADCSFSFWSAWKEGPCGPATQPWGVGMLAINGTVDDS